MAFFQRLRDFVYAGFFLIHLGTSLLIDTQLLCSQSLFPKVMVEIRDHYVKTFKDPLVGNETNSWVNGFLYLEMTFMVPFLIVGFFGALFGSRWMRIPSIIYGTSLVTMCIPLITYILFDDFKGLKIAPSTQGDRIVLAEMYGFFLLGGLMLTLDNVFLRSPTSYRAQVFLEEDKKKD